MANYLKILLLIIFVTAPVLDIAFLDSQEPVDHFSEAFHGDDNPGQAGEADFHCICHVLHHGASVGKISSQEFADNHVKAGPFADVLGSGLHPKPGLHPPSIQLS